MVFRCTKCKTEPEFLIMFGKFVDNKEGMEDEGEYCEDCFEIKRIKYGLKFEKKEIELDDIVVL